jgi:competence protein ComEC
MTYKQVRILFTGDVGKAILDEIAEYAMLEELLKGSSIRIYKVPHHGSRDGISEKLLSVFQPSLAAISSGQDNLFKHPHQETLESLNSPAIKLYRTDKQGTIEVTTNGDTVAVKTEK